MRKPEWVKKITCKYRNTRRDGFVEDPHQGRLRDSNIFEALLSKVGSTSLQGVIGCKLLPPVFYLSEEKC